MTLTQNNSSQELKFSTVIKGVLTNSCPNCLAGKVFSGIYRMNTRCLKCALVFEKEPGYFLGALVFAYFIGAFSLVPTLIVLLLVSKLSLSTTLVFTTAQISIMHPILFRYSKLIWLYVETRISQHLEN